MMKKKLTIGIFAIFLLINFILSIWWSVEPDLIRDEILLPPEQEKIIGYATITSAIFVAETLLDKPGGFLSNDVMPPSVFMDNMPAFELGALDMLRDLSLILRRDLTRSRSQSAENQHLQEAHTSFNIDRKKWILPSAEGAYRTGIEELKVFRKQLMTQDAQAQFYARADNLTNYLSEVSKRLGSTSSRLSASVGREQLNIDFSDMPSKEGMKNDEKLIIKTSWWLIDDVFYEARGQTWALLNFLRAFEHDFVLVLEKKNAVVNFKQIIRELEMTQEPIFSPMILNGSGFGIVTNHSLVMGNYISRANAAIIDLNILLKQG